MDENTFYSKIWKLVGAVAVAITLSISGCVAYQSEKIAEMVKGGAWIYDECRSDTVELSPTHWMPLPPPPKEKV